MAFNQKNLHRLMPNNVTMRRFYIRKETFMLKETDGRIDPSYRTAPSSNSYITPDDVNRVVS